jgi:hypothetical protein
MASGVRDEREISTYIGRFVGKKLGETFDTHVGLVRAGSGGGGYERGREEARASTESLLWVVVVTRHDVDESSR